jgi:hypothetical protein
LEWSAINFEAGTITVSQQIGKTGDICSPKAGEAATIPLLAALRPVLVELHLAS